MWEKIGYLPQTQNLKILPSSDEICIIGLKLHLPSILQKAFTKMLWEQLLFSHCHPAPFHSDSLKLMLLSLD